MACPEFEYRLIEYAALEGEARACVDTHLAECAGCREFLEALRVVDAELTAQFGGREVSAAFAPAVRRRVERDASARRLSFVPEVLDFVGWGAIVALLGLMAWWVLPVIPAFKSNQAALSLNAALAAGGAFVLVAVFIGLRSLADLKR
jgi:predicted anti-sigma-YlaC factor YlaD